MAGGAIYGGFLYGAELYGAAPSLIITSARQVTLNAVEIVFDLEPQHLDPEDPDDGTNIDNYTVTGPVAPFAARLVQVVTYEGDDTIRVWFDGPLVPGELYAFSVDNIVSTVTAAPLAPSPTLFSFIAFGADSSPVALVSQPTQRWDLRNPQAPADAPEGAALGTFVIDDDGDLGVETRRKYLRKRIFRRLTTRKGSIVLEPTYGLDYEAQGLQTPARLRRLQQDAEMQIRQEPGVTRVRASVAQHPMAPGIVVITLRVFDEFGDFSAKVPVGGGE